MQSTEYEDRRARIAQEFTANARKERDHLLANPGLYCFADAMGIVGVDKAIYLLKSGHLSA